MLYVRYISRQSMLSNLARAMLVTLEAFLALKVGLSRSHLIISHKMKVRFQVEFRMRRY